MRLGHAFEGRRRRYFHPQWRRAYGPQSRGTAPPCPFRTKRRRNRSAHCGSVAFLPIRLFEARSPAAFASASHI
jgi:hypothetical protein